MQILIFIFKLFYDLYFDNIMPAATEGSRLMHTWYLVTEAELQKYKRREILKLNCRFVTMLPNMQESSENNLKKCWRELLDLAAFFLCFLIVISNGLIIPRVLHLGHWDYFS